MKPLFSKHLGSRATLRSLRFCNSTLYALRLLSILSKVDSGRLHGDGGIGYALFAVDVSITGCTAWDHDS